MCTHCAPTGLFEMIVGVVTTCHTQYISDSSICIFHLIEQHSKFLLHTLQVLYMCTHCDSTGLFEMIVGVVTTCHKQYSSDRSICIFLFNRTTLQFCVTYITGALYLQPLCFYRVIRNDCRGFNNLSYTIHLRWQYLVAPMDLEIYVPPLPASIPELKVRIRTATETISDDMLQTVWNELDYRVDVCRITKHSHIEHL